MPDSKPPWRPMSPAFSNDVSEPVEFECLDCSYHVFCFGTPAVPEPPLCASCAFIREHISNPEEAARMRALLCP